MAKRELDQSDFDLDTFVDLFDEALTSDNPAVKKAFKNLMLVAAIVSSEHKRESIVQGPMRRLVDDVRNLHRRINNLESQLNQRTYVQPAIMPVPNTYPPYAPGKHWTTDNTGTGFPPGTIIGRSTTAYDDQFTPDPTIGTVTAQGLLQPVEDK